MKKTSKAILERLLHYFIPNRQELNDFLLGMLDPRLFVPPGHFYSPIPSLDEIKKDHSRIFRSISDEIPGIDLRKEQQFDFLQSLKPYYEELPFTAQKRDGLRYFFENPAYSYSDAIFLYCMIRHIKPKRFIEIGSGYSSCVTLDTNELFFDDSIQTIFIEPFPELLLSLLKEEDKTRIKLISSSLQDVDPREFDRLGAGDILFVDSSHVVKFQSDVQHLFSEILPRLADGVYVHFHDIFYPFEYPERWIYENRAWNEIYFLKAFLQYNSAFQIVVHNRFLEYYQRPYFEQYMPLCLQNLGASIWIQRAVDT